MSMRTLLACLAIGGVQTALSAPGEVLSQQKISQLEGGFTGVLDTADWFSLGLGSPGDLDDDGVTDLIAGAFRDDDGGTNRGALWVLFLNPDGTVGLAANNLTRLAQQHIAVAGLKPWPKIYQAMRSTCENDWKQKNVAEATYAAWIGHSPTVSRKHYVAPTDQEFAAIAKPT